MNITHANRKAAPTIAVIPARGGSRRIPGKNMADIGGKPAIAHTIRAAKDAGVFDAVMVSTDDATIADCARAEGVETVNRPANLADDFVPILPVVKHTIELQPWLPMQACLLLATAIMIRPEILREAHERLLADPGLDYVIGVRRFASAPQRALIMGEGQRITMQKPENFNLRSQDMTPLFHDAGQFSFGTCAAWMEGKPSFISNTVGIEISRWEAVDIDEPEDLAFARMLYDSVYGQ